jgi:alkylhydroperoxidase family enzyme
MGPFTDQEKVALRLATVLANTSPNGFVNDSLMGQLEEHFSDGAIVELAMVMAVLVGVAKMLFALDLVTREESCPFLHPSG